MKITLDELRAFATVVDAGSISAAANLLEQTVSGVSRALNRLEAKLETTLLRRTTRRLELTEEGTAFLARACAILDSVDAAEDEVAVRRQQPVGRLRVDAASPFMLHVIVPHIGGFRRRFPRVELELNSNEGIIDLIEKRTDVAFRIGPLKDSSLHARKLGSSRLRVLASPDYLRRAGTPARVADLGRHSLLGFNQPESLNRWPLRHADGEGLRIEPSLASSSGETLRQLALAGEGIACLSDFMTRDDVQRGRLVPLLARATLEVRQPIHAVYYRNAALAARITCFIDYMAAAIAPGTFDR